jgi:uncharacterized protein with ParB-like and HNH nuclease domain
MSFGEVSMEYIKNEAKSIQSIVNDINKNRYDFDLPIQRRAEIWNKKELSLFIDSIIPLYPIYPALLNRHSDTKILDVVDFKQRFTGLAAYVKNDLEWVHNFLEAYDSNEAYLAYCGSGTASAEMVKRRLSYFREAIREL